jgi:hypothetical protein
LPDSRPRALAALLLGLALAALLAVAPALAAEADAAPLPSRDAVHAVVKTLRDDPDLSGTERRKSLRWKKDNAQQPRATDDSWVLRLLQWLAQAMSTVAEVARWLIWLLAAVLVAALAVTVRRWMRVGGNAGDSGPLVPPTRVGSLDVRPETLPDRIGAAARALWLQGRHRAALSLLYRGALSRLIHGYAVPIRAAHTEAECLGLAQERLAAEQRGFFGDLVRVWQLAVYGAHDPDDSRVQGLCEDFDRILDPPRSTGAAR